MLIAAFLVLVTPPARAYEAHVEQIMTAPTVTHTQSFHIDASVKIWDAVLGNPYLLGQLWGVYEFEPRYMVTRTDTGVHVSDPSGIIGDIRKIGRSDSGKTFFATGACDHWAIPSFFTASGVVTFTYSEVGDGLAVASTIFMRGDNGISRFVMRLFSGILTRRIANRVGSTLKNAQEIISDISDNPHTVRTKLTGQVLRDFDRVFPEGKEKPGHDEEILSNLQDRMY
jgi:hypothetical protein